MITPFGEVIFAAVNKKSQYGKFELSMKIAAEDADLIKKTIKDLIAETGDTSLANGTMPLRELDDGSFKLVLRTEYDVNVVDKDNKSFDGLVFRGSVVRAKALFKPYEVAGRKGISGKLIGVQVKSVSMGKVDFDVIESAEVEDTKSEDVLF